MKNSEAKNIIEIEGVILTEESISLLKSFQANDNDGLRINMETIASAIFYIANLIGMLENDEMKKAAFIISDLSSVRDNLSGFRKP